MTIFQAMIFSMCSNSQSIVPPPYVPTWALISVSKTTLGGRVHPNRIKRELTLPMSLPPPLPHPPLPPTRPHPKWPFWLHDPRGWCCCSVKTGWRTQWTLFLWRPDNPQGDSIDNTQDDGWNISLFQSFRALGINFCIIWRWVKFSAEINVRIFALVPIFNEDREGACRPCIHYIHLQITLLT